MADIGELLPVPPVLPVSPGAGTRGSSKAPSRKPDDHEAGHDQKRRRRKDDDDASHIDEYA